MILNEMNVFAGPNGSGKSTLISEINKVLPLGIYINADDIESTLKKNNSISFSLYGIRVSKKLLEQFYTENKRVIKTRKEEDLWEFLSLEKNVLSIKEGIDISGSYLAGGIATFIRMQLLNQGRYFSFETVMSRHDKISFLELAKQNQYFIKLFFITTSDPKINIRRIQNRVKFGGHDVPADKVESRYYQTLDQLSHALKYADEAYLFDNSYNKVQLVAKIINGKDIEIEKGTITPRWFHTYVLNKY
jgi:predicted ABC-type ATPase